MGALIGVPVCEVMLCIGIAAFTDANISAMSDDGGKAGAEIGVDGGNGGGSGIDVGVGID